MKPLTIAAVILGIILIAISFVYFTNSANSLPSFFPGYQAGLDKVHYKHGIGSLLLGLAAFIFAWFQSGKKSSDQKQDGSQDS